MNRQVRTARHVYPQGNADMSTIGSIKPLAAVAATLSGPTHAGLPLQRKCACGSPTASLTGECAECTSTKRLQTKLTIGASNDPLEAEADRVADQVLARPIHSEVSSTPPRIQRYSSQSVGEQDAAPASVERVLTNSGSPLEPALRHDMEQRFGHDFSRVRVHSGTAAEQSAWDLNANAYTVGEHIVFGVGRFAPSVHEGRRLVAHELTHVMQQGNGSPQPENRVDREVDDDKEEDERKRHALAGQPADASGQATTMASKDVGTATINSPTADVDELSPEQSKSVADTGPAPVDPSKKNVAPATQRQTPSAQPNGLTTASAVTPGGHAAAPKGMAPCPDAPGRNLVVLVCSEKAAAASTTVEKAELPKPNPARFGGDADRAKFAKDLAQCHAVRIVNDEIDKRYRVDVAAAKKQATDESKSDREAAIKAATEGIDPKDKGAIGRAKTQAAADAKKVSEKKIVDAQTAVTRQDIATVTAELAAKFEDALAADYDETVKGAFSRFARCSRC